MNDIEKLVQSGAVQTVGDLLVPQDLILVFDIETTGLPVWNSPSDHVDQPHIVSLAAELCTSAGEVLETYNEIVNVGVPIPADTIAIHGITDAIAKERGIPPKQMLAEFFQLVDRASLVVGYNVSFDLRMVRIQSARHFGDKWDCPKPKDDSMWIVAKQMNVKKPKLVNAYEMVFGRKFDGAHNALADTSATREIYFEMVRRGYVAENPRVVVGSNQPPADPPVMQEVAEASDDNAETPFDAIKKEIEDLYGEAKNWLDGEPIANEGQAAGVGALRDKLRNAKNRAEAMRKTETKPVDEAKKAIQDRYNPLIKDGTGIADRAVATCNEALKPWLKKLDDEQRANAQALRDQADRDAKAALEAAQTAAGSGNLEHRERAEDLLSQAKETVATMKHAEKAKPQVHTGVGRAIGMKSVWIPELVDPAAAIEHYRKAQPAALKEWMIQQAITDIRVGSKPPAQIPGFTIREDRVPV